MTDERPRPRYGEYATPQEQAEIVAKSLPPVSPLLTPGDQPNAVNPLSAPRVDEADARQPIREGSQPTVAGAASEPSRKPRTWDRILSMSLLGYGLFTVVAGMFQYADLASVIQQVYDTQDIGTFRSTGAVTTVGIVIRVGMVALWAVTALLTVRVLRSGRLSFYIPLIGGVVATLGVFVLLAVVLISDPGFMDYVQGMQS